MTTTNYHAAAGASRKPSTTTCAYDDDPTFLSFRAEVWKMSDLKQVGRLSNSKLYALWYVSKTFARHWRTRPSNQTANDMIFILGHNFLTVDETQLMMLAWLKMHFPKISQRLYEQWLDEHFFPTWDRIQPSVEKARERKNALRRKKRQRNNMRQQDTARQATLKDRIAKSLEEHPMTTALLASKLNVHPKAVDGQLSRMKKTGVVVKLGRGLYALPGAVPRESTNEGPVKPIQPQPVPSIPSKTGALPIRVQKEVEEGVAEWNEPQALEPAHRNRMAIPGEVGVCYAPDLKTAEPNWNRKW